MRASNSDGRIFVSGANGYVGRALCADLRAKGHAVRRGARTLPSIPREGDWVAYGDLAAPADLRSCVAGCDVVIHLAAHVHILDGARADADIFTRVNVEGTRALARAAAAAGVSRFVFVSTLGVHGADDAKPLTEDSIIAPATPYARSKWQAEQALQEFGQATGLDMTILRPAMVYGPHCPGNLARLAHLVRLGVPLPIAAIENRRSLIGINNLVAAIWLAAFRSQAAGGVFLVSDGEDVSTPEIVRLLAEGMGRPVRQVRVPAGLLLRLGRLAGRGEEIRKLVDSLRVDNARSRAILRFHPVRGVAECMRMTGRSFARP